MGLPDNALINVARCGLEYLGLGRRIAPFPVRREARPLRREEIPHDPALTIGPPDFVGVGEQKSGTSWWASLIEQHPEVVPNRLGRKEMHYLSHFLERNFGPEEIDTYHAIFARPNGKRCGEWTPNYMPNPQAIVRLKEAAPEARILVLLRNPIDRYESGFNHERKQRFGGIIGPRVRMEVVKEYALRAESIWNGMYGSQLEVVYRTFPKEQVLVLQYEACLARPEACIRRTYAFLGLDEAFRPEGADRKVNAQRRLRAALTDEARRILAEIYRPDVRRLIDLCPEAIDLSLWDEFET